MISIKYYLFMEIKNIISMRIIDINYISLIFLLFLLKGCILVNNPNKDNMHYCPVNYEDDLNNIDFLDENMRLFVLKIPKNSNIIFSPSPFIDYSIPAIDSKLKINNKVLDIVNICPPIIVKNKCD